MPILEVSPLWSGRDGEITDEYKRSYRQVYFVRTSGPTVGQVAVAFADGIPRLWDPYVDFGGQSGDLLSRCRRILPRQHDDDPTIWEVTCEFETWTAEQGEPGSPAGGSGSGSGSGGGGAQDRPDMRPPVVRWEAETMTRPLIRSLDNGAAPNVSKYVIPVRNSVGQAFDPLPEFELAYPVLHVERYEATHDPLKMRKYYFAVNDDPFLFANPHQAQLLPVVAELEFIGALPWWKKTYRVRFVPEGLDDWQTTLLDAGRYELQGNPADQTKEPTPIFDPITRQPVTEDWPLNGAGKALSRQALLNGQEKYTVFYAYRRQPFAPLKLV